MDPGPHQKVFLVEATLRDGEAVAVERTLSEGPGAPERAPLGKVVVTRHGGAERFKETVGSMLKATAKLLYVSPVLLAIAPIAWWLHRPAPAYLLALFACVAVLFFAVFDLFIVASIVAWARRKRGARAVFLLPSFSEGAAPPAPSRELLGRAVRCVGRATLLTTGTGPILRAGWWTDATRPTELVECSTFAVVPESGTPVVVRHLRAPRLVPDRAAAVPAAELRAISDVRPEPPDAALVILEGDLVEVEGTAVELIDNASHFEIDGVSTGLPAPDTREDDPYRQAPGGPAVLVDNRVVIRKVGQGG